MAVGLGRWRGTVAGREVVREPAADVPLHDPAVHAGGLWRCAQNPVAGDGRADLLQDLLRIAVFERVAHQDGEGRQDLPVRPAVAEGVKPLSDLLHRALRIRERAVLLGVGARRQHDVGQPGGLRQEELLHDQQLQLLQRLGGLQGGRQAPYRILAYDDQSLEPSAARRFDHLEQAQPFRDRRLLFPDPCEQASRRRISDVGRAGQVLGHRAHLDGALLVVLLGERREPPARLGQLADEQQEVHEIHGRLIAARSLQQILPDQDHPPARAGKGPDHRPERGFVHVAWIRQGGRRLADARDKLAGARAEAGVHEVFVENGLDEALDGGAMAADLNREVPCRQVRDVAGGVDRRRERLQREERGAALLHGLLHLQPDDRIGGRDLGADEQEDVGLHEVLVGDRPAVGPLHAAQRAGRIHVPITGRAVQVVRADRQAHELLEDVQVLVGAAGRDEPADGFGAVRQLQLRQPLGECGEHLVPRGGVQLAVRLTVQRAHKPVLVGGVLVAEEAPRAQVAVVAAFAVG